MKELQDIIGNFGFPIAVATYLLIRMEQRMKGLEDAIYKLSEKIEDVCKK